MSAVVLGTTPNGRRDKSKYCYILPAAAKHGLSRVSKSVERGILNDAAAFAEAKENAQYFSAE